MVLVNKELKITSVFITTLLELQRIYFKILLWGMPKKIFCNIFSYKIYHFYVRNVTDIFIA